MCSYLNVFAQCDQTCLVISEFAVNPDQGNDGSPDETGEFIELFNTCDGPVDIGCMVLCLTEDQSGVHRGDCVTIPAGTTIPAGGVFLMGGYGTNCTGGVGTCDWSGLSLDLNWHADATTIWDAENDVFHPGNVGSYIGVLHNSGEEITLFDATGTFLMGVTYEGGSGTSVSSTENIGAVNGCAAQSVTIPPTSSHSNNGNTPGGKGNDEGWQRDCAGTFTFTQMVDQTPGVADCATLVSCIVCTKPEPSGVVTNESCTGDCLGSIDLTVTGGSTPYTYKWNTGATIDDISSLCAGNYTVTVTENGGCDSIMTFTVSGPPALVLSTNGLMPNCQCPCAGAVWALPSGGDVSIDGSYDYSWSNGSKSFALNDICAGTYNVTITDDKGCTITGTQTIP